MKQRLIRRGAGVIIALAAFALWGCQEPSGGVIEPSAPEPATIQGSVILVDGLSGSVENSRIAIYRDLAAFEQRSPCDLVEVDATGSFEFCELRCEAYYLDAWKDNDGNGLVTSGDFYFAHKDGNSCACQLRLTAGQATSVRAEMEIVQ